MSVAARSSAENGKLGDGWAVLGARRLVALDGETDVASVDGLGQRRVREISDLDRNLVRDLGVERRRDADVAGRDGRRHCGGDVGRRVGDRNREGRRRLCGT